MPEAQANMGKLHDPVYGDSVNKWNWLELRVLQREVDRQLAASK